MIAIEARDGVTPTNVRHRSDDTGGYDQIVELLYSELHGLARRQLASFHGNATLQTTAVVNEAYLKLQGSSGTVVDRKHFLGIAAKAMRHVVIDYARKRMAEKRGGDLKRMELRDSDAIVNSQAEQLLAIDDALGVLADTSDRLVRIFECKFFAGLSDAEAASVLGISKRSAQRDWMKARALLAEHLSE